MKTRQEFFILSPRSGGWLVTHNTHGDEVHSSLGFLPVESLGALSVRLKVPVFFFPGVKFPVHPTVAEESSLP